MKQIKLLLSALIIACLSLLPASGQSIREELYQTIEKTAGVHYIYHYNNPKQTPAPTGYKPFYISHYGRHGSRWQTSNDQYTNVLKVFEQAAAAHALSPLGEETYRKIAIISKDAVGLHAGDLSPLGAKQHKEIAGRMYHSFPNIFEGDKKINAYSTVVPRCILSMASFCDELKGFNPKLQLTFEANTRTTSYLNFMEYTNPSNKEYQELSHSKNSAWRNKQKLFRQERIHPQRIVSALFSDTAYVRKSVDGADLMTGLFSVASNLQNVDLDISLYDLFEKEELYNLWIYINYKMYAIFGASPLNKQYPLYYASPLLKDMINLADSAILHRAPAADFRFGHDISVIPLAGLLQLEGCYAQETELEKIGEVWQNFRVTPMAANIQFVFFRKEHSDDILVKILHNEVETHIPVATDIFPYYHWKEVKKFYCDRMDKLASEKL